MTLLDIPIGARGEDSLVVATDDTVGAHVAGMPLVFATPRMIWMMECAAAIAAQPHLPPGWVSVGTAVDIKHLAATPVGRTVVAVGEVRSVEGRWITFDVEAHDGVRLIGRGTHQRAAVETASFTAALADTWQAGERRSEEGRGQGARETRSGVYADK